MKEALGAVTALEHLDVVSIKQVAAQLCLGREPHLALHTLDRLPARVDLAVTLHVVTPCEQLAALGAGMVLCRGLRLSWRLVRLWTQHVDCTGIKGRKCQPRGWRW